MCSCVELSDSGITCLSFQVCICGVYIFCVNSTNNMLAWAMGGCRHYLFIVLCTSCLDVMQDEFRRYNFSSTSSELSPEHSPKSKPGRSVEYLYERWPKEDFVTDGSDEDSGGFFLFKHVSS